jgi:predicted Zn-dependent peptidase
MAGRSRRTSGPRTAAQIAATAQGPRPLPDLGRVRRGRVPATQVLDADSGLRIVAVRRPATPLVEIRLRIPFGGTRQASHPARAELLAETILLGTGSRTREQVDADLAVVGGELTASVDPQRLLLSGSVLSSGLEVLLGVMADVLTDAAYRRSDVLRERDRLAEHLVIATAQPSVVARNLLQRHRFGDHPAAREMPTPAEVESVGPAAVRGLHARGVLPRGSTLVLVGDLYPARAADAAARALAGWVGDRAAATLSPPPAVVGGPLIAHHRVGAVQSQVRLTAAAVPRADPDYPAVQLANTIYGGYFSSRLVENLREDKGYTYSAHSALEFWPQSSAVTVAFDTTTGATAPALWEAIYELGRIALVPPTPAEVEAARNYAIGGLAISLASQAGYASMLSVLAGSGLDGGWLRDHPTRLAAVTPDEIAAAASRLFAPSGVTGVVVGDLDAAWPALGRIDGIERS